MTNEYIKHHPPTPPLPPECSSYGSEFVHYPGYYLSYSNVKSYYSSTTANPDACAALCLALTSQQCLSYEVDEDNEDCHLQVNTAATKPGSWREQNGRNVLYWQRQCQ